MMKKHPYFLWDYDLSEEDVHTLVRTGSDAEKRWIIARILSHAKFEDVWQYIHVEDILRYFGVLKMRPKRKEIWKKALTVWGYHV